jgi:hypothetical protein
MIIANPIYDSVFKFLMEDTKVAKRFLSILIGEEILSLELRPQEQTVKSPRHLVTVYRLDFKAIIKTKKGENKKILIELQKGKQAIDLLRFRRYLGDNYINSDEVNGVKINLPIITIYFLGFELDIKSAVVKIDRKYTDLTNGKVINQKDEFIEKLSHDGYFIQIPRLPLKAQTKVEKILSVFNQKWVTDSSHRLLMNFKGETADEDVKLLLKRLELAASEDEIYQQSILEETFDESLDNLLREKEVKIEEQAKEIENKDKELENKAKELENKDKLIAELMQKLNQK